MEQRGHYYTWEGESRHFIDCVTREGNRPTTIADCRKNGWLPSITTILSKTLAKPDLIDWLRRETAIAALTTPRMNGETVDAFVERILCDDSKDTSRQAMDLGSEIHAAIEEHHKGRLYAPQFEPFVKAAMREVMQLGRAATVEKVYVHPTGYAGRADLVTEQQGLLTVLDYKTCKTLPKKGPWPEALLQTGALADCLPRVELSHSDMQECESAGLMEPTRIQTAVLYISTTEPGATKLFVQQDWQTHAAMFQHVFALWKFLQNYDPAAARLDKA